MVMRNSNHSAGDALFMWPLLVSSSEMNRRMITSWHAIYLLNTPQQEEEEETVAEEDVTGNAAEAKRPRQIVFALQLRISIRERGSIRGRKGDREAKNADKIDLLLE